ALQVLREVSRLSVLLLSRPSPGAPSSSTSANSLRLFAVTCAYFRNSSIISTCVIIILRQQYLLSPSSSRTFWGLSPARTRWLKVSHLSAICLPHVKHLTGIIILGLSPVRFLLHPSRAGSA